MYVCMYSNRKLHLLKMICHSYSIHNKMDLEIPSPPLIPFSATIRINPSFRAVENKCPSPEGEWKKSISDLKMINPLVLKLFSVSWAQQKRKQKGKIWLFAFDNTAYSSLCLTVSMGCYTRTFALGYSGVPITPLLPPLPSPPLLLWDICLKVS